MSKQVTVSDIFEEELSDLLLAAMRYVQRPSSTEREYDYIHAGFYEYDTRVQRAVRRAVATVLMDSNN